METKVNLRKRKTMTILFTVILVLILAAAVPFVMYNSYLKSPISSDSREVEFQVKKGASTIAIIDGLSQSGIIENKLFARIYVKRIDIDKSLRTGIYKFNTSMTPEEVFQKLKKGAPDADVVSVTIPEGYSVKQIAERLKEKGVIASAEAFIKEANNGSFDYEFLKEIPKNRPSRLEGYLFPDTYEFKKGITEKQAIEKFLNKFKEVYEGTIKGNLSEGQTLDKIMIMASLVEREAVIKSERPIIAGVFYSRIDKKMALESCATIEYALGVHKDVYTFKDLEVESPYNTYKYPGLPAGPIANPGKSSIEAALKPEKTKYFFFVAKGDGSHLFGETYAEHLKNINSVRN